MLPRAPGQGQQGVALIMAILAVTLASIAAVAMATRQQVDIRRTANVLNMEQASMYVYGGEAWAGRILSADLKNNSIDTRGDNWATVLPPVPVEGGQIGGFIQDQQARFNLNSLILSANRPLARQRFERLLDHLGLDKGLADSLIDWLDPDGNVTLPDGAEDNEYLGRGQQAYRTANRPLAHVSELLLIQGFDRLAYERLLPFVCAINADTAININTAPKEVILTLAQGLTDGDVEPLLQEQERGGFSNLSEFTQHSVFAGKGLSPEGLSLSSQHFLLTSRVMIGRARQEVESLLYRGNDGDIIVRLRRPVEH
ncbi:MAG: type II secretion system minor pseudopilin GspK [Gammaproteobacteria bacterium]